MKKKNVLALSFLLSAFSIIGCSGVGENYSSVPYEEESNVVETSVYLGLCETKAYTPNAKLTFNVTIQDPTLLTYENGSFTSYETEGNTLATFTSDTLIYKVTVSIKKDSTVPDFTIETEELSLFNGTTYSLSTSLTYKNKEVAKEKYNIKVTKETATDFSEISLDGTSLNITGKAIGSETYTIYTEYIGFILSKTLTVNVKNYEGLVVCGRNLTYNELGPAYKISMYKYSENPVDLKEDISVFKAGVAVPFANLTITMGDTSILSLDGSKLVPHKSGDTFFSVTSGEETIKVWTNVYKPFMKDTEIDILDKTFDLDMSVKATTQERTFTPSATSKKVIKFPGTEVFTNVNKIEVDGKEIAFNASSVTYDASTRELTLPASMFKVENYGKQKIIVYMEGAETVSSFSFVLDFVTKYLTTYAEFAEFLVQKFAKDVISGQYILKNDLDAEGKTATGVWISGANDYSYGFRGVLDGAGHAIKNYRSSGYGLMICIGNGAVIKNIKLSNVFYRIKPEIGGDGKQDNRGEAILGRFIGGATFEDIEISLDKDKSITTLEPFTGGPLDSTGLICTEVFQESVVRNMTIHAEGFDLLSIFGKNISNSKFYNINVYCKSLKYVGRDQNIQNKNFNGEIKVIESPDKA